MKRILILMSVSLLILSSCTNGQKIEEHKISEDSVFTPETKIKLNKEYDKNGNLIEYDSSYSEFHSNIKGNTQMRDSIFMNFKSFFHQSFPFSNREYFNDLFFNDTLLLYDFYKKDFFGKRFDLNRDKMNELFRELDSVKNEYYKNYDSL
jgi:hypothetical protein